ncbi:MAG: hypothetical protein AMJ69_09075 [Gammaproteobacteria bacterium SG8_47]|nr:MAG: hypothetical protein AMJ69_09075 [Gammaproteobacteria bacterium SG8_47]
MLGAVMKVLFVMLIVTVAASAAESVHILTAEQWAVPRSGQAIVEMPALQDVMAEMRESDGSRLIVRYPGGDEGTLWARELHAWLVALGLGSQRIEMQPGSRQADTIEMQVVPQ